MMEKNAKIYVAGHRGMVGSAIVRELERQGYTNIITRTHADFMYDNMMLEMNVIHAAWQNGCKKLEFLGSSCIYPRMAP